jgi:hypothetical protein
MILSRHDSVCPERSIAEKQNRESNKQTVRRRICGSARPYPAFFPFAF